MSHSFKLWLKPENFKPIMYYPYTSVVINRILEQSHNYITEEHNFLEELWAQLWDKAEKAGAKMDNKIVIELESIEGLGLMANKKSNIFLGKYDGRVSVGLGMYQPDSYTKQYNLALD